MIRFRIILEEYYDSKLNRPKGSWVETSPSSAIAKDVEDDVLAMIKNAYQYIGGNPKAETKGDIERNYTDELLVDIDKDPEPDVVLLSKDVGGRLKIGTVATDGSRSAVIELAKMERHIFELGGFAEASGKSAKMLLNNNIPYIQDEQIVRNLLGKNITWYGKNPNGEFPGTYGWYSRTLGNGQTAYKLLFGKA